MKLRMLLTAALSLSLCCTALAELDPTPVYTYNDASEVVMLQQVDRLGMRTGDPFALATFDGTLLTDAAYTNLGNDNGWVTAVCVNETTDIPGLEGDFTANGVLSADGQVVVPFQYPRVNLLNEHWAVGYRYEAAEGEDAIQAYVFRGFKVVEVSIRVTGADLYNLDSAACVTSVDGEQYKYILAKDEFVNIGTVDGAVTAYDASFQPLSVQPYAVYDFSYTVGEEAERPAPAFFYDAESELYGLKDTEGNVIIDPAYEYAYVNFSHKCPLGVFFMSEDDEGLYGLMTMDGTTVLEPEYEDISLRDITNGYAEIEIELDGDELIGVIDPDGSLVVMPEYEDIYYDIGGLVGYLESDDEYSVYTLANGVIDLSDAEPMDEDTCYIFNEPQALMVCYYDEETPDLLVNADGVVTELDWVYSAFVTGSNGMFINVHGMDYVYSVLDNTGRVVLEGYEGIACNDAGTYMLAKGSDGVYALFAIN